jgi:1,2-diacylglycerol 3-alpha-glucosyltransferase
VIAVIWTDWYAYHVARLRALDDHKILRGKVLGIELVGGCGMHSGMRFRSEERGCLPIDTLLPEMDWATAGQRRVAMALWRRLRAANPTMVLVPGYYTAPALFAALWARLHRRRSVLMAETTREDHHRVWWKETAKRWLIKLLFDSAIAGGKAHVRYLRELGIRPDSIRGAYDVVDNQFYASESSRIQTSMDRRVLGLPEDYFLFVGRLAPEKNVDGLLRSFADYRTGGGSASLVLCGEGPLRESLARQAEKLGVAQHVHFAGMKSSRELPEYYAFARCFILPSTREPWGLVVNEAMASGLPVLVSSRCGSAEDLVEDGANGFVFDPYQPDALTSALQRMGALSGDSLAAMGQRSREIIAQYSPEIWASEVVQLASHSL